VQLFIVRAKYEGKCHGHFAFFLQIFDNCDFSIH
jgi:hypothetical protein